MNTESISERLRDSKKFSILFVGLLVVFMVVYSFLFLNFSLVSGESATNSKAEDYRAMEPETNFEQLYLYVEEGKWFNGELESSLKNEMSSIARVDSYANLKEKFDGPALAVKVLDRDLFYTPLYTSSKIRVFYFFSSSGNTSYYEKSVQSYFGGQKPVIKFKSSDGPQLIQKGTVRSKDTAYGLISYPASKSRIAQEIADEISQKIGDLKNS